MNSYWNEKKKRILNTCSITIRKWRTIDSTQWWCAVVYLINDWPINWLSTSFYKRSRTHSLSHTHITPHHHNPFQFGPLFTGQIPQTTNITSIQLCFFIFTLLLCHPHPHSHPCIFTHATHIVIVCSLSDNLWTTYSISFSICAFYIYVNRHRRSINTDNDT